jgi:hypothetical protein
MSWACGAPLIPALGIRRQEDQEFEASLGYIVSSRPAWAIKQDLVYKKKRENGRYIAGMLSSRQ